MKIGILSVNMHTKVLNFASPLHSMVFQNFLKDNGIDSTIIDYKPCYFGKFDVRHPLFSVIDKPDSNPYKQERLLKKWRVLFYEREKRFDRFDEFIKEHYKTTDKCYNQNLMDKPDCDLDFDCYICVTDIIWKRNRITGFDRGFWLASKCMDGKKKIAYTPSRGATKYKLPDKKQILPWLADFDYISVRENSLKEELDNLTGLDIPVLCDPVFFMDKEFYTSLARKPENAPEKPYVLTYIVMEENPRLLQKAGLFAKEKGLDLIELNEDYEKRELPEEVNHRMIYDIGVEEWLWYILNAEYIFTNSFHEIVLAIIMQKQFFVGKRAGDKIDNLLSIFNLEDRRVADDDMDTSLGMEDIDFAPVEEKRKEFSAEGKKFILDAIHDLEGREHRPIMSDEQLSEKLAIIEDQLKEDEDYRAEKEKAKGLTPDGRPLPQNREEAIEEWNRIKRQPKVLKLRLKRKIRNVFDDKDPEPEYIKKHL